MKKFLKTLTGSEMVRYLFFGGCTIGVNLSIFSFLCYGIRMSAQMANLLSIVTAVLFAFVVNRRLVFQSERTGLSAAAVEFVNFVGMRGVTLLIEFFGVDALMRYLYLPGWGSKILIQIVVVVMNYIISKFWVFRVRKTVEKVKTPKTKSGEFGRKNIVGGAVNE